MAHIALAAYRTWHALYDACFPAHLQGLFCESLALGHRLLIILKIQELVLRRAPPVGTAWYAIGVSCSTSLPTASKQSTRLLFPGFQDAGTRQLSAKLTLWCPCR